MIKRIISVISVIFVLSLSVINVFSANMEFMNVTLEYFNVENSITIKGEVQNGKSNQKISVKLYDNDYIILVDEVATYREDNKVKFKIDNFIINSNTPTSMYTLEIGADHIEQKYVNQQALNYTKKLSINEAIAQIQSAASGAEIKNIVEANNIVLGLDINNELFTSLSADDQLIIYLNLKNHTLTDLKSVDISFRSEVSLSAIEKLSWIKMTSIVGFAKDIEDLIGNQYYPLLSLSQQEQVLKNANGTKYATLQNVKTQITNLSKTIYDNENTGSSGGGGGSSSGGGGGGSNISHVTTIEPNVDTPVETDNFLDIDDILWAKDDIKDFYNRKIISGDGSGYFHPNNHITRAEFVKMVVLSFDLYEDNEKCEFKDVLETDWHYKFIASATSKFLLNGIGDSEFSPNEPIKRQDMAVILDRVLKYKKIQLPTQEKTAFLDLQDCSQYAYVAVKNMYESGLINGSDGYFRFSDNATKAEVVKMISNVLRNIE